MNDMTNILLDANGEMPNAVPQQEATALKDQATLQCELLTSDILILDDEPTTTAMIRAGLSKSGFVNVHEFNSPKSAIKFISGQVPALILLDIHMPGLDGITLLKFLRKQAATKFVPVIVLTSERDDQTRLEALTAGANDFVNKPVNPDELVARVKNSLAFRMHVGQLEQHAESVKQELKTDVLTGLENRRAFDERFAEMFENGSTDNLSLIMFDIDHFKTTNDNFGHQAGDNLLRKIGEIVRNCCDESTELAARIGGDEFAILCRHTNPSEVRELAENIRERVARHSFSSGDKTTNLTVSVGVATNNKDIHDKGGLFCSADAALYESKQHGRNQVCVSAGIGNATQGTTPLKASKSSDRVEETRDPKLAKILIVDDEPTVTQMLKLQLNRSGYENIEIENDALQAMERIRKIRPDLVILDVRMPGINGLELLRLIREEDGICSVPVLVMTASDDDRLRVAALKLQASDFLTKPTKPAELDARVYNSLLVKFQHDRLNVFADRLAHEVEIRTNELFATRRETILCMARAADSRDTDTGNHVIRVGHFSAVIARKLGFDEDHASWIELAAQLHDVGKLSIPDSILRKPGSLTDDERAIVETHCDNAEKIFFGWKTNEGECKITSPLLKMAAKIAYTHHEKWDGSGYPQGLVGEAIPIEGRITAVADVFDALSSKRSYKDSFSVERCMAILEEGRATHFDPKVLDAFASSLPAILEVRERWLD